MFNVSETYCYKDDQKLLHVSLHINPNMVLRLKLMETCCRFTKKSIAILNGDFASN